jgi:hypothetical protein
MKRLSDFGYRHNKPSERLNRLLLRLANGIKSKAEQERVETMVRDLRAEIQASKQKKELTVSTSSHCSQVITIDSFSHVYYDQEIEKQRLMDEAANEGEHQPEDDVAVTDLLKEGAAALAEGEDDDDDEDEDDDEDDDEDEVVVTLRCNLFLSFLIITLHRFDFCF